MSDNQDFELGPCFLEPHEAAALAGVEISQRFWSMREVADSLNVSEKSVRNWIALGLIGAHRFGGLWRIAQGDLTEFLRRTRIEANKVRAGGEPGPFGEQLRQTAEATDRAEEVRP